MSTKPSSPSTVTSTGSTSPWEAQQPYLKTIFSQAQDLYQGGGPQYYPDSTVAAPTGMQNSALTGIDNLAWANQGNIDTTARDSLSGVLQGNYVQSPGYTAFNNLVNGYNPGTNELYRQITGPGATDSPALSDLASQMRASSFNSSPAFGELNREASSLDLSDPTKSEAYSELNRQANTPASDSPAWGALNSLSYNDAAANNPALAAFGSYASGARTAAGNPYIDALSKNVMAQVAPGIESQFIQGGGLNSPEAARATASGVTSALAPSLFQNYQNEEANQLAGAQGQSNAYLQGLAAQTNAANIFGNQAATSLGQRQSAATALGQRELQGQGLRQQAAQALGQQGLAGLGLQQQAANLYGQQGLAGLGLRQNAASTNASQALQAAQGLQGAYGQGVQQMLGGLALAPQVQTMPYTDLAQQYAAGATGQSLNQQSLNDLIARYNYTQTLPYQQLNELIGQITGNYGGATTLTQPYFQNAGANALGGALGGASLGGMLGTGLGVSSGTGALGGAGIGALLGLL